VLLLNPRSLMNRYKDSRSAEIMTKTITFFEEKGLARIKEDDQSRDWYQDFLTFVKEERVFATLLTPEQYGRDDTRWDMWRNEEFNEILGFYGLCYWYTWQVSILGLGPIWMSENEKAKKKVADMLDEGGVFAFGLSEKEHGADLYSSSMSLMAQDDGSFVANGSKYYIGNGNKAARVAVFGKNKDGAYVWFLANPEHPAYTCRKIDTSGVRQAYVAEIHLKNYPVPAEDILSEGEAAWDAALNTVNVGKYQLGWASIGICTHAFYEALNHASKRQLYGKYVTDFPHVKVLFTEAYSRMIAMKMYGLRSCDYLRTASRDDRRYLLYNPIQKMKVTMEGEAVVELLHQVIAAKGFEQDTYFEMAIRDIGMLPKLEGTVHVNVALVTKFMKNYFFAPQEYPKIGKQDKQENDAFLFDQGPTKGLSKVTFHSYEESFKDYKSPNLDLFLEQAAALKQFLIKGTPNEKQSKNMDYMLQLGELFTLVPYGQLITENRAHYDVAEEIMEEIYRNLVKDFSKYAVQFYTGQSHSEVQAELIQNMIKAPQRDEAQFEEVWSKHVLPMKENYLSPR